MSHTTLEHAAPARATLHVGNLHYASEKAVVERVLANRPGVISVDANPVAQTATVSFDPAVTSIEELARWIEECGYHCAGRSVPGHLCDPLVEEAGDAPVHDHAGQERADEAYGHGHGGHAGMSMAAMVSDMRNRFLVAVIFSIPIALWSPIGEAIFGSTPPTPGGISDELWQFLLSLPVVFYASMVFFRGAWNALKARTLDMMVLVAVAIGTGWLYSVAATFLIGGDVFYEAAVFLAAFVLLGHWFEMRARGGANDAIHALLDLAPPMAVVLRDGEPVEVPTAEVAVGDLNGDHGRHRPRRQARHPLQERDRARAGRRARHGRLRQDGHAHARRARGGRDRDRRRHGEDELLGLVASAERESEHPLAEAIVKAAQKRSLELPRPESFEAVPGHGARAVIAGHQLAIGNARLLEQDGVSLDGLGPKADALAEDGRTVVHVALDRRAVALIAIADAPRDTAREAVAALAEQGVRAVMLTGDNEQTAQRIAREVGIEEVIAEVLPGDKAARVRDLQAQGRKVAMVGDGVNDAPALAQADVGIAIGTGTDVAVETADVVLMRSDPLDVATALTISRGTLRKMRQNLGWAIGYNSLALPIAAGVFEPFGLVLRPEIGAISMSGSSILVALNAVALKRLPLPGSNPAAHDRWSS